MATALENAGKLILDTEKAALADVKVAVEAFDAKLAEINDRLAYPTGLALNAPRIIMELRGQTAFRVQEVDRLTAAMEPPATPPAPVPPAA